MYSHDILITHVKLLYFNKKNLGNYGLMSQKMKIEVIWIKPQFSVLLHFWISIQDTEFKDC